MKFYTKPEIRFFARYFIVAIGILFSALVMAVNFYKLFSYDSSSLGIGYVIAYNAIEVFWIYVYMEQLHDKLFARLEISQQEIVIKCVFRKKKVMLIEDCRFVGVELEDSFNKIEYPFIYFALSMYPREFSHKINKLKNTNQFIKFWYTDDLAKYVLVHFPKEKTGGLQYYFNCKKSESRRQKRH